MASTVAASSAYRQVMRHPRTPREHIGIREIHQLVDSFDLGAYRIDR
jgi:hypothetical protein